MAKDAAEFTLAQACLATMSSYVVVKFRSCHWTWFVCVRPLYALILAVEMSCSRWSDWYPGQVQTESSWSCPQPRAFDNRESEPLLATSPEDLVYKHRSSGDRRCYRNLSLLRQPKQPPSWQTAEPVGWIEWMILTSLTELAIRILIFQSHQHLQVMRFASAKSRSKSWPNC